MMKDLAYMGPDTAFTTVTATETGVQPRRKMMKDLAHMGPDTAFTTDTVPRQYCF